MNPKDQKISQVKGKMKTEPTTQKRKINGDSQIKETRIHYQVYPFGSQEKKARKNGFG